VASFEDVGEANTRGGGRGPWPCDVVAKGFVCRWRCDAEAWIALPCVTVGLKAEDQMGRCGQTPPSSRKRKRGRRASVFWIGEATRCACECKLEWSELKARWAGSNMRMRKKHKRWPENRRRKPREEEAAARGRDDATRLGGTKLYIKKKAHYRERLCVCVCVCVWVCTFWCLVSGERTCSAEGRACVRAGIWCLN
jgi:hypothetical protein